MKKRAHFFLLSLFFFFLLILISSSFSFLLLADFCALLQEENKVEIRRRRRSAFVILSVARSSFLPFVCSKGRGLLVVVVVFQNGFCRMRRGVKMKPPLFELLFFSSLLTVVLPLSSSFFLWDTETHRHNVSPL